jgi:hypothetical protein
VGLLRYPYCQATVISICCLASRRTTAIFVQYLARPTASLNIAFRGAVTCWYQMSATTFFPKRSRKEDFTARMIYLRQQFRTSVPDVFLVRCPQAPPPRWLCSVACFSTELADFYAIVIAFGSKEGFGNRGSIFVKTRKTISATARLRAHL